MRLSEKKKDNRTRILAVGDSGAGKTGSLAALANAGYRLFVCDFDDGWEPLDTYLEDEAKERVFVKTFRDRTVATHQGPQVVGAPMAFVNFVNAMEDWKEDGESLGGIEDWGPDTILVIDSGTHLCHAIENLVRAEGRNAPKDKTTFQQIGDVQSRLLPIFDNFLIDKVKCHIIVNFHLKYRGGYTIADSIRESKRAKGGESGPKIEEAPRTEKGYPTVPGRAIDSSVGTYFNYLLYFKVDHSTGRRVIATTPEAAIDVKCPVDVPAQLPIETGLADIFEAATGHRGPIQEKDN